MEINNVSEMLRCFMIAERDILNNSDIIHAPTIGEMYEGLTKDILKKAIPSELNLSVVNGFIHDGHGGQSRQIDCMVVHGEGEVIRHTNKKRYHVKDVVAIFEVKKELLSEQLKDSIDLLTTIDDIYFSYRSKTLDAPAFSTFYAAKSFERITGKIAPRYDEKDSLSILDSAIYHSLVIDQLTPVRIAIGYNGYKSEYNFRQSFYNYYSNMRKFRTFKIPSLLISDGFSIVKQNGYPYYLFLKNRGWCIASSCKNNPLILILEVIFYKIKQMFDVQIELEEVVENENMTPLVLLDKKSEKWDFTFCEYNPSDLKDRDDFLIWTPLHLKEDELSIIKEIWDAGGLSEIDILAFTEEFPTFSDILVKLLEERFLIYSGDLIAVNSDIFTQQADEGYYLFPSKEKHEAWKKKYYNT
ncbi:DUF6602 domain-containing protein [Klebsiella pneumoniae]|uniref:DUF6602 domain-containing protein n=1 Tax=Klebsiella pneumoniae TaxID=573 RepID=UPI0028A49C8B|nr:hypothetical protein [Klebsiella pneumoniae]